MISQTTVLLVEQNGDPDALSSYLADQLTALDARTDIEVLPLGHLAESATQRLGQVETALRRGAAQGRSVALVTPALVVPDAALLASLDDPSRTVAALVSPTERDHPVASDGVTVLSASTALHPVPHGDAGFLGLIYVSARSAGVAADAIRAAIDDPGLDVDLLDLVLTILVRGGAQGVPPVTVTSLVPFPGGRATDDSRAMSLLEAVESVDDRELAMRSAARPGDGFYSTFVLRRIAARLTPWAVRHGVAANIVTAVSALIGMGGGVAFAFGAYPALVIGAVLLQISLVLDCVDGEIARSTRTRSAFGGWLDGATDRVKEYAALAGLACAGHHLWIIAAVGMVVQTARHLQDFAFAKGALAQWHASFRDDRPLTDTSPWSRPGGVERSGPLTPSMWLRRILHMPIGERWLVLSVFALSDFADGALVAYLALAVLAGGWTMLGAIRRTTAAVGNYSAALRRVLADYRDDGVLDVISRGRCPGGVAGWALPAFTALLEGAAVVAATALADADWNAAAFGWFAVVAWHRYDVVYRRGGATPAVPRIIGWLGGGWLLRTIVVLVAAATGVLPAVLIVGIVWLFVVYVPESVAAGARTLRATTA